MAFPLDEQNSQSPEYNALGSWLFQRPPQRGPATTRPDFSPRKTGFNVWDSMLAGARRFSSIQDAEYARRKAIEEQQTMQLFGQQKYLPGYEGVQGAELPGWLGRLYAANPELGMQVGERVAAPFAQQREISKEVQTEAAKRQANMEVTMRLAKQWGFLPNR
ncbi:MAG: hypothetical protein U0223_08225 [Nitrospira sp.]|nr:hypothetical protein [Nitrospira sp.]